MQSQTHDVTLYRAWELLETNKKHVGIGLASVVVVGLIIWFLVYQRDQKKVSAGTAFSKILITQALEQQQPGAVVPETPDAYLKVASTYPSSRAGSRALLLA